MDKMSEGLEKRVRQLLIEHWDPIGLDGFPQDEYDGYGRRICAMIVNSRECTSHEFAKYLISVAEDMMGLPADLDRIQRTADELADLRREVQSA